MRAQLDRRSDYFDLDGYITADEASAILARPRSGFGSILAELGVLGIVMLGFATAGYAAALRFGFSLL
jgi:hypothetical protein